METVIKRPHGLKVKIVVRLSLAHYNGGSVIWEPDVFICKAGKRYWHPVADTNSPEYKSLPLIGFDRKQWVRLKQLQYVTEQELLDAMLKFWEKIKPKI
jgi:hypothetical protein